MSMQTENPQDPADEIELQSAMLNPTFETKCEDPQKNCLMLSQETAGLPGVLA
jgi:hypothetical protein